MITSQYTVSVRLFDRKLRKYFTLQNTFNTIIELDNRPLYMIKQSGILEYIRDSYDSYLLTNGLSDSDINISSYKVETSDAGLEFYFIESDLKNTPKLMCRIFETNNFFYGYETFSDGVIYSWDSSIKVNVEAIDYSSEVKDVYEDIENADKVYTWDDNEILSDHETVYNNIIVELYDPESKTVLYTSTTADNHYIETVSDKNTTITRKLRVYTSTMVFIYETDEFTITPQEYNTLPTSPAVQDYSMTEKALNGSIVPEKLPVFQSGVGYGKDCFVDKNYEDYTNIDYNLIIKLLGNYDQPHQVYDKVSFYYKGQCDYKQDYEIVDGKVVMEASGFQYGSITMQLHKYASEALKINYNLKAKMVYFGTEADKPYKDWRTVDVVVPMSFTHDISDYLYYAGGDVRVKGSLWYGVVDPQNSDTVNALLLAKVRSLQKIEGNVYHLIDYGISDVKVYRTDGTLLKEGHDGPLDVSFQYVKGQIDVNAPVKYYNKGLMVFEGEKYVTSELDNQYHDVLAEQDFNFPMVSRYDGRANSGAGTLKISVFEKDANIESNLNEQARTCTCRSTKNFVVAPFDVNLDEKNTGFVFDMYDYIRQQISSTDSFMSQSNDKFNYTIKVTGSKGPVNEHGTGTVLNTDSDVVQIKKIGNKFCGKLCAEAVPVTVTRDVTLYEPVNEYVLGNVNGDANSFLKTANGKRNLSVNFRPFLIPSDGYNVQYAIHQKDTLPEAATVTKTITPSTDQLSYSFNCLFASTYMSDVYMNQSDELETYTYAENISSQLPKNSKYVIDKPTGLQKEYTSFMIGVDTDNPEACVKEYSTAVEFVNDKANVFTRIVPQKHPASDWKLKIRNGYYYLNQHENFMFCESNPSGPSTLVDGVKHFLLTENAVQLSPIPQQFSPVIVEADGIGKLRYIVPTESDGLTIKTGHEAAEQQKEFKLGHLGIDEATLLVRVNGSGTVNFTASGIWLTIADELEKGDEVEISYKVLNSFSVSDVPGAANSCLIKVHTASPVSMVKVSYETSMTNNYSDVDLSINPVHNLHKSGFVYMTEDADTVHSLRLVSTNSIKGDGKDKARIYAVLADKYGNPSEGHTVTFARTTGTGTLLTESAVADRNGVAIATYKTGTVQTSKITATTGTVSSDISIVSY